ncbi:MAG: hypothetical protein HDKAJFGB_00410 [Anaerolineae bacterium]|nr:hypothetical protein [Anaerolineae bacterium]
MSQPPKLLDQVREQRTRKNLRASCGRLSEFFVNNGLRCLRVGGRGFCLSAGKTPARYTNLASRTIEALNCIARYCGRVTRVKNTGTAAS